MASATKRQRLSTAWLAVIAVVATVSVYGAAVAIGGLDDTWALVRAADPRWLLPAALAETISYGGWVVLLKTVADDKRVRWRDSVRITLAGVAATRLLAAGGAGGVALTVWALRRRGLSTAQVARAEAAQLVTLYGIMLAGIVVAGLALAGGPSPAGLTLIPAILAALVMVAVVVLALTTTRPHRPAETGVARWRWALGAGPRLLGEGLRHTARLARRRRYGLAGGLAWWVGDALALWCACRAFGVVPAGGVLVLAYLLGQLGNLLPVPGGVGGIDGAMIAALIALGVQPGDAALAVLTYRGVSFWLPTIPGVIAYISLVREGRA
ncbi:MAG TPA: lysylphosphatidylglycerol synthase transmembrane domain-containing protein [Solirubrobacter sp.]|jgi:uncharacterized membrane protein YbhN (UPF0104 family)|nr:lysylphosphatidylglycerol synthase transmembrane domain-containing protein [Solirubrobacter sp.]